jgi:hypothetical protein
MEFREAIALLANFAAVAALVVIGLRMFAQYHSRGKWAKNVTALLGGFGLLLLAVALLITPRNADAITRIARTKAHLIFLIGSSILLVGAMTAYGLITYSRPFRLQRERQIEEGLRSELPKLP